MQNRTKQLARLQVDDQLLSGVRISFTFGFNMNDELVETNRVAHAADEWLTSSGDVHVEGTLGNFLRN
jgi:hypothetical protein